MATSSPNPPNPSLSPSAPPVLTLSRDEMRARALAFSKRWAGPQREESEAKTFLDEFFTIFGRDRHAIDAVHEYRVERPQRGEGRIDLLWPGKLLVEMKSTGRDREFPTSPASTSTTSVRTSTTTSKASPPARTGKRAPYLNVDATLANCKETPPQSYQIKLHRTSNPGSA